MDKRRVLFIAEAVTLAHVARLVALARSLDASRYAVVLACDPRYNKLIGVLPFPVVELRTIPAAQFFNAIARGSPIYSAADLTAYVEEDLRLLDRFRPDVVVGDFRLSLDVSATLGKVPYITIANAYWSPYARLRVPVPDIPVTRVFGAKFAQWLFDFSRPVAFALHAAPLNRVRRKFGLPRRSFDLRETYTRADVTLYADIAEIVPTDGLPDNHRFIGPISWSPAAPLPDWWDQLPADRPVVYATLGSSGQGGHLSLVLEALADLPVTVIAATAGKAKPDALPANARVADFLPGDRAAEIADLVICNGGSPTSYQGLAAGKPVIGVAGNLDQYLNMSLVAATGAGMLVRGGDASVRTVRDAVERLLADAAYRRIAQRLQAAITGYATAQLFEQAVMTLSGQIVSASGG